MIKISVLLFVVIVTITCNSCKREERINDAETLNEPSSEMSEEIMEIQTANKYLLWGEETVNEKRTTAVRTLCRPHRKEKIMTFDKKWEGDDCNFFKLVKTPSVYRMYYNGHAFYHLDEFNKTVSICMLESDDGLNWKRAEINRITFEGSTENNIIKDSSEYGLDNFIIFYDENPNCPKTEKYKALTMIQEPQGVMHLYSYLSEDGIEFRRGRSLFGPQPFTDKYRRDILMFDTANIAFWDKDRGKYVVYLRGIHDIPNNGEPGNDKDRNLGVRDIRYAEPEDFIHWSIPQRLEYDNPDCSLYTNCVSKYNETVYIGFPTRYNEYKEWGDSFDELSGADYRREIIDKFGVQRYGLAITDCLFMYSYDGKSWKRFDEAFYTPGEEGEYFWMYGSCYPCANFIETKDKNGEYSKISLFLTSQTIDGINCEMYRYEIRKDGFVGYYGDFSGKMLETLPFEINGEELFVNFSTSAAGYVRITLKDEAGNVAVSQRHFGDSVKRKIKFDRDLSTMKGKVVMTAELKDAWLYSFEII